MKLRRYLLFLLLGAAFVVAIFYSCGNIGGPQYVRAAQIKDIAWGKDGSLYMIVQWVVKERRDSSEIGRSVVEFDEDAVYRLDPDERVVRRLPMAEAREVVRRWPDPNNKKYQFFGLQGMNEAAHGWVLGRYAVFLNITRDTYLTYKNETQWAEDPGGRRPIQTKKVVIGLGSTTFDGVWIKDWKSESATRLPGFFILPRYPDDKKIVPARLSPDDRYVVYEDSPARQVVIRWLPEGPEVVIPDTIAAAGSLPYPTTSGLLVPSRGLYDPETFERIGEGWDPFAGLVPGQIHRLNPAGDYVAGFSVSTVGTSPRREDWSKTVKFTFPSEVAMGRLPETWKDLYAYPTMYTIPNEKNEERK